MSAVTVKKVGALTGHSDCVYALQQMPGGAFSAAGDGMVVRWDLGDPDNGELVARLPNSVYALCYVPSQELLVAGQNYEGIHLLDWKNKKEVGSLHLSKSAIFDIQPLGDNLLVALGSGEVLLVDPRTLTVHKRVQLSDKSARCIAVNPVHGTVALGFSDHFIRVIDHQLNVVAAWQAHLNSVFTLRFTPDGNVLLSGGRDARIRAWDAERHSSLADIAAHMYAINHLEFSPDGKHFVTCSMDKSIKVWDTGALRLLKVIDRARHAGHGTSVNKLLWTSYNDQLLSASDDRTISIWHIIF